MKACMRAAANLCPMGFTTGAAVLEDQHTVLKISCGSKELDDILDGGMESGSITEIYGENRMGKTQICHTLAVTCQVRTDSRPDVNSGCDG